MLEIILQYNSSMKLSYFSHCDVIVNSCRSLMLTITRNMADVNLFH